MKRNRVAVVLIIVLGALSFWFFINNKKGTIKETLRDFAVADTASINKIFLADKKGNQVTLKRAADGKWMVNDSFAARPDAVEQLLVTMKRVDVKEPVSKAGQNNVVKRLAAKAVRCEIYQNDVLTKAYYVGTETQDQTGTYMILIDLETMEPSEKPFVTYIPGFEGYLTTRYFTEVNGWKDRTVFSYRPDKIKSVKLETPFNPDLGYELKVNGLNQYELSLLKDHKSLPGIDTLAVKQFLSYFQQLNFESFEVEIKPSQIDSVLKSQPINILTVTDDKGQQNKVTFFARKPKHEGTFDAAGKPLVFDPDRMDALLNNGKDFVMVQYLSFGKVMPPANYFLKDKAALPLPPIKK